MSNHGLQEYLEQLADGNESVRRDFYEILAQSIVYIPAIVKENDKLVRCIVSMMQDYSRPTIPVFLTEKEVAEWSRDYSSISNNETVIALLAADLCSSLDLNTQLAVSPGSNTVLLIGPEQVDSIASTPFDPPSRALESSEILKEPKKTKPESSKPTEELNLIFHPNGEEIDLELSPLSEEENKNSGAHPEMNKNKIDPELSGTLILHDNDITPPAGRYQSDRNQHEPENKPSITPHVDNGKTQFLRPLQKKDSTNPDPNKNFVQQPRRRFGG